MKAINKYIILILVSAMLFTNCKKEECTVIPDYNGKWVGTYNSTNDFTLILNDLGTLGVVDGLGDVSQATGTWTVIGKNFRGTYRYTSSGNIFSLAGTVSDDDKTINGTYGVNSSTSGGGTFTVTKQ
ncbi:MAG: hypothetical protein K1X55_09390 [Chitinophagales bacterium]|nr:hypothetical protein [Chitinophagales bacterium]